MNGRASSPHWQGPAAAWAAMCVVIGALCFLGSQPPSAERFALALPASVLLLAGLAFGLVGVVRLAPIQRLAAGAGFLFIALLLMLSFTDIFTRAG